MVLTCLMLSACGKPSVTGVYVAKVQGNIVLLDLVQVERGDVTGRLEWIGVQPDGDLSDVTASVSGLSDGKSLSLAVKPVPFLPASTQITGKRTGDHLSINMGETYSSLDFARSNIEAFHAEAAKLRTKSRTILAAREAEAAARAAEQARLNAERMAAAERANLLQRINELGPRMRGLTERLDNVRTLSPKITAGYVRITEQMGTLLARQRAMAGREALSVQRSQLSITIGRGVDEAERLHDRVQRSVDGLGQYSRALGEDLAAARTPCRMLPPGGRARAGRRLRRPGHTRPGLCGPAGAGRRPAPRHRTGLRPRVRQAEAHRRGGRAAAVSRAPATNIFAPRPRPCYTRTYREPATLFLR